MKLKTRKAVKTFLVTEVCVKNFRDTFFGEGICECGENVLNLKFMIGFEANSRFFVTQIVSFLQPTKLIMIASGRESGKKA